MAKTRKIVKAHGRWSEKDDDKYSADNGQPYLDKRTVVRLAKTAGKAAADNAMHAMGYVVIGKNGWLVKKYPDGQEEQIAPLD